MAAERDSVTDQPADKRIGARTLRGAFWAYFSYVGGRLLILASTSVLARLLTPKEFGIVGYALVFMALLETVKDLGLGQALVASRPKEVYERADTVFLAGLGLGVLMTVVVAGLAPLAAAFFDEPQLLGILPVLGLNFFIRSIGATHYAIAQKEMLFRTRTMAEFADVVVRGTVGVVLALLGAGVWSLVIGYVAGTTSLVIALWILVPWRPRLRLDRRQLPGLLRFGGALTGVDVTSAITNNADYLFVGKVLGASALGVYTLGFRLPELAIVNVATVAGIVLFPAFANVDRDALSHAYLVSLRYLLMLCMPLAAGVAILAAPLVQVIFGSQWHGAVEPMRLLTIYAFAVTVGIPAGTAYKAVGRAGVLLKLAVPRTTMLVAGVWIFVSNGLTAVAAVHAVVAGLFSVIGILLASRLLGVTLPRLLSVGVAPLAATAAMSAVLLGVNALFDSAVLTVLVGGVAGGAVYVGLLGLLAGDAARDLRDKLRAAPPPDERPGEPDPLTVTRETDVIA
jgi:O-antigen/teichoic acid export membrane protein